MGKVPGKIEAKGKGGILGPVKVSKTLKSIGAVAYDEDGRREVMFFWAASITRLTSLQIRVYFADEANILREIGQTYTENNLHQWTITNDWHYGTVGSKQFRKQLAPTTSISAAITHVPYIYGRHEHVYPIVQVFYTDRDQPTSISCAHVTITSDNRGWATHVIGPRPADHIERIAKDKLTVIDDPPPSPLPRPSKPPAQPQPWQRQLFAHYHVSTALGFGFFFGLVAGIVLDRPFWGYSQHRH